MSTKVQLETGYDHAGKYETSILMALYKNAIDLSRVGEIKNWFTDSAKEASVELGNVMVKKSLKYLNKAIK